MAQGSKKSYTNKQKRMAKHIEDSAKKSGKSSARAKQIAYATINKEDGGGKKSGSGRGKSPKLVHLARVRAGKKAAATRKRHESHKKAA